VQNIYNKTPKIAFGYFSRLVAVQAKQENILRVIENRVRAWERRTQFLRAFLETT
jgi:hypothetical protein